ncbi:MAG: glycogen synthase [Candidatus Kerfeldbacteria bacterium]|nr:glycogen synthase [Candidatus Kerfeldbacteria bacterium]
MNVMFVSAEAAPLAKVGGLADVVGALPLTLKQLGVEARIIMPKYEHLERSLRLELVLDRLEVPVGQTTELIKVYKTLLPGSSIVVYLIANARYLSRGPIYDERGTADAFLGLSRFLFFSRACVEVMARLGWQPDIVHCHDWHTGLTPALLNVGRQRQVATVFTIHNLAYQGVWSADEVFSFLGLRGDETEHLHARDRHGDLNLMQQAIRQATRLNTVSPTYAKEILTPECGRGLEEDLRRRQKHLVGILNGIDIERFNPASDPDIRVRYDRTTIHRKVENKLALHEQCGFPLDRSVPTFGFVGRLAEQKGVDLILATAKMFVERGARLVVLGSGMAKTERALLGLANKFPNSIAVRTGFDARLAQNIYAGSDIFLMPSRFEPCGIGQMIAMRYGTIPLVRATGGLHDTVPDIDRAPPTGLGFSFNEYEAGKFWEAVERSLNWFRRPSDWQQLIKRVMAQDFSWSRSARSYLKLYEQTIQQQ